MKKFAEVHPSGVPSCLNRLLEMWGTDKNWNRHQTSIGPCPLESTVAGCLCDEDVVEFRLVRGFVAEASGYTSPGSSDSVGVLYYIGPLLGNVSASCVRPE